jgi:hypothetical protein
MFADEARFGRMNRIRPCWAPIGTRPEVAAQLIREYTYLYGAVTSYGSTGVTSGYGTLRFRNGPVRAEFGSKNCIEDYD